MTSQIPGISSTQSTAPVNAVASQQSNVTTPPEAPITQIDEQNGAKSMSHSNYDPKTVESVLQNTYLFSENEARQISAFATAVQKLVPECHVDVNPGFLNKIKALCAKILKFFGNNSKTVQLHKDGIAVFNELKECLLDPKYKKITLNFIENNIGNPEVAKGFGRIFGLEIPEDIKSSRDFYTQLMNPQLLKALPDVKKLLEQVVLPISEEEVLAGLTKNLKETSIKASKFEPDNQIFKDLGRNFKGTFYIDNKRIEIGPFGLNPGNELAYQELEDAIKNLQEDMQEKVREFCKGFPAQGVFSIMHPRLLGPGRIDSATPNFDIYISQEGVHVVVSAGAEEPIDEVPYPGGGNGVIKAKITTPMCKFEFDYNLKDGSSSNVQVTEYSGQTTKITSGTTAEGDTVSFNSD